MSTSNGTKNKYFGTDGIRGVYGETLTDSIALLVGGSLGASSEGGTVVVGRDNRTSGESLARALAEGVLAAGGNVLDLGVVTTPCVACLTAAKGAFAGAMISASHNPPSYNGIKIFGADGRKLSAVREEEIEARVSEAALACAETRGRMLPSEGAVALYADKVKSAGRLDGLKIVLDCANGAAAAYAPAIFADMGAEVVALNTSRDGNLINDGCGALFPEVIAAEVVRRGADMGFSFDGDADRVIAADEKGNIVDGDKIIYVLARMLKARGELPFSTVVGTLHTNMGAEAALAAHGIKLVRTDIGDHNVVARMCAEGFTLGGEQSGHIIIGKYLDTGDGVLAGAVLAKTVLDAGKPLSELADCEIYPQVNVNVRTAKKDEIVRDPALLRYAEAVKGMLSDSGRLMLRGSGTENKLRIMAESKDPFLAAYAARSIEMFIRTNFTL